MSTAIAEPAVREPYRAQERLLTAADLAALPTCLPTGDVKYELNDGRLVVMAPPGAGHGRAGHKIGAVLERDGEAKGHGIVFEETGIVLRRNPDRVVGADAAFILTRSLPYRESPEGYLETIPEIVVEVRSKNDSSPEVESKAREYLTAGVFVVWVIDPQGRTVTVYRASQPPQVLTTMDDLTIPDVIPSFRVSVGQLFPA